MLDRNLYDREVTCLSFNVVTTKIPDCYQVDTRHAVQTNATTKVRNDGGIG